MHGKISVNKLNGVPETLLYSLRARYRETKKPDGVINDPKSVEIMDSIDYDFSESEVPWAVQISVCTRTKIFDEITEKFLEENPGSVVVNLGCGLDTRFARVDNGRVLWYDLDLPEAIELRKHFFQETERLKFIAKSVLDFSWVDEIQKSKKTLFLAEGLLYFFTEDEVKSIIATIKNNFPKSELLFEVISPFLAKRVRWPANIKLTFKWTAKTGKSLEKWDTGIQFLKEWNYLDVYPNRWRWMRLFRLMPPLKRTMTKTVHLRFM